MNNHRSARVNSKVFLKNAAKDKKKRKSTKVTKSQLKKLRDHM